MRGDSMKAIYKTDTGKIRSHNEDNGGVFFDGENYLLSIVADGMGGHLAGDVASSLTLSFITEKWKSLEGNLETKQETMTWLETVIGEANNYVLNYANENEECRGMGTTIVVALCTQSFASIANVGDSRCYLFNGEELTQITEDHSLVNELVRSGQLSKQDAQYHPKKNVLLRALGTEHYIDIDTLSIDWNEGDMLLLCSDGLTNKVDDSTLTEILISQSTIEEKASRLIELANGAGGEDNITLSIVLNTNGENQ